KLVLELGKEEQVLDRPHGIVAHGLAGWVSLTYAAAYPQRVRRQTLVSVCSGKKAQLDGIERLQAQGQQVGWRELEFYAPTRLPGWKPNPGRLDEEAAARMRWTTRMYDYRDLTLGAWLGPLVEEPDGSF